MNTTISKDKITLLSKKGMKELKKEIVLLENDKQKILKSLRELDKTQGRDERLIRIEMLAELDFIDSKIDDKKLVLSTAKLLPKKRSQLRVAIGSVVDLIDKHGHFFRFKLVNSIEADPSDGRISTLSPLGQNLIGKSLQDTVEWGNGIRINSFQLVRIT
jgi:transcription elongation factor GreA